MAHQKLICDEAPAFQSVSLQEYFKALNIQPIYISPMNHGSNRSERYIRTLNDIITKCLVGTASYWPLYIDICYELSSITSDRI